MIYSWNGDFSMESMQFGGHGLPLNYEQLTQAFNLGADQQLVVVDRRQDNRIHVNDLRNEIAIPVDIRAIQDTIRQLHEMIYAGKVQVLQKRLVDGQEHLSLRVNRMEMESELQGATFIQDGVQMTGPISVTYDAQLTEQLETAVRAHSVALGLLFSTVEEAPPTPQTEDASTTGATTFQRPDTEPTRTQKRSPESDPQKKIASAITQAQIARTNREKIERSKLQRAEAEEQSQRDIEKMERIKDKEEARETARAASGLGSSDPIQSEDPIAKENASESSVEKAQKESRQKKVE